VPLETSEWPRSHFDCFSFLTRFRVGQMSPKTGRERAERSSTKLGIRIHLIQSVAILLLIKSYPALYLPLFVASFTFTLYYHRHKLGRRRVMLRSRPEYGAQMKHAFARYWPPYRPTLACSFTLWDIPAHNYWSPCSFQNIILIYLNVPLTRSGCIYPEYVPTYGILQPWVVSS
jgi:hypothetical protein